MISISESKNCPSKQVCSFYDEGQKSLNGLDTDMLTISQRHHCIHKLGKQAICLSTTASLRSDEWMKDCMLNWPNLLRQYDRMWEVLFDYTANMDFIKLKFNVTPRKINSYLPLPNSKRKFYFWISWRYHLNKALPLFNMSACLMGQEESI